MDTDAIDTEDSLHTPQRIDRYMQPSLQTLIADTSHERQNVSRHASSSLVQSVRKLMDDASLAQTYRAHTPVGMHEPTAHIATPAVRSMVACLKTESLPALFDKHGQLLRVPGAAPAGVTVKLDAGLIAGSRVAKAGGNVLVYPEAAKAYAVGRTGTIAFESIPAEFRNIEAAAFESVNIVNEDDAPTIALPIRFAAIDWTKATTKGVRFEIKRSERRRVDPDLLCAEIVASLILGLSHAADETLLSALSSEALTVLTLGQAAAEGLLFDELRGLVGTLGIGAQIGQDGALRVGGVAAELTGSMTGTIVGAWNRAGVAINEDVSVHFERLDTAGSLAVTAWASMLSLVPDANKFWTVA